MSMSFPTIPANVLTPFFHVEFDNSAATPGLAPQRALLIGQATTVLPVALRYAASAEEVAAFAGAGSVLARMAQQYRANDPVGEMWVLPLQDAGGGVFATGTIAVTGPATAAGAIALYIGGRLVTVPVTSGQAATAIATAIAAAITANAALPVTAAAAAAVVTLTARNRGTLGNSIDIRHSYRGSAGGEALPAGVGLTITAMASGATDPDLAGVAALLGDAEYDFICQPITTTGPLDAMRDMMNDTTGRWSYTRQAFGHVFAARADTVANLITFGTARNDQHATNFFVTGSPTPPEEIAAACMAAAAVAVRADPARPLQTVAVQGLLAPVESARYSFTQRESLLGAGGALLAWGPDGSASFLRVVTSYRLNRWGQTDRSYLDVETLFTLMAVVRRLRSAVTQKFARSKLASDGTRFGPGQPIVTPSAFKAELVAQYATMEADGLVEDLEGFARATIVQRNPNDPSRLDVLYAPNLINGLRVLAVLAQFRS